MATYRGSGLKPEQTGDVRKDVSRLYAALYEMDEELRYLFGHLGSENFTGALKSLMESVSSGGDDHGSAGEDSQRK